VGKCGAWFSRGQLPAIPPFAGRLCEGGKRLTQAVAVQTHDAVSVGVSAAAALLTESSVCVGNALVELKIVAATMGATLTKCLAALPSVPWLKGFGTATGRVLYRRSKHDVTTVATRGSCACRHVLSL
jgi:hypothetical protein